MELPPGFRFHPTDEELITHYLSKKIYDINFTTTAMGEVDLNKCEPWDLPWKAKMGGKELYFFCVRDRKYPTGLRTNRATESGYWKATGKDKEIFRNKLLIGMKKTLVFYKGRAPKGEKTDWIMHEFRLDGKYSIYLLPKTASKNEWVICRVFKKTSGIGGCSGGAQQLQITRVTNTADYSERASVPTMEEAHVTCFSNFNAAQEIHDHPNPHADRDRYTNNLSSIQNMQQYCYYDPNVINGSLTQLLRSDNIVHGIENFCKTGNNHMLISDNSHETGISTDGIYE